MFANYFPTKLICRLAAAQVGAWAPTVNNHLPDHNSANLPTTRRPDRSHLGCQAFLLTSCLLETPGPPQGWPQPTSWPPAPVIPWPSIQRLAQVYVSPSQSYYLLFLSPTATSCCYLLPCTPTSAFYLWLLSPVFSSHSYPLLQPPVLPSTSTSCSYFLFLPPASTSCSQVHTSR